jgi:hypothetical protein
VKFSHRLIPHPQAIPEWDLSEGVYFFEIQVDCLDLEDEFIAGQ